VESRPLVPLPVIRQGSLFSRTLYDRTTSAPEIGKKFADTFSVKMPFLCAKPISVVMALLSFIHAVSAAIHSKP
jgi:hypothetical protein